MYTECLATEASVKMASTAMHTIVIGVPQAFLKFWPGASTQVMSFSPSILTKGEQSHSVKNKHPYLSLLPLFRQREPRTSTMEVKCFLYSQDEALLLSALPSPSLDLRTLGVIIEPREA